MYVSMNLARLESGEEREKVLEGTREIVDQVSPTCSPSSARLPAHPHRTAARPSMSARRLTRLPFGSLSTPRALLVGQRNPSSALSSPLHRLSLTPAVIHRLFTTTSRSSAPPNRGQPPNGGGFPIGNIFGKQERKPGAALEEHGVDLTALAREGKLDPVIGRDEEIKRVIQILSRRTKVSIAL
jgi:ATP-dependent Clp protease ATP-binding subunit ClpA